MVVPTSPLYDELRNVFNQAGSPAVIVRAQNNDDIVTVLRFAREHQFMLSVRSGGHRLSGQATNNGGLVLDLTSATWRPLEPYSRGAYLNFLTDANESNIAEVYPSTTYARLASIKAIYDPDNVFNQNQNIKPAFLSQA